MTTIDMTTKRAEGPVRTLTEEQVAILEQPPTSTIIVEAGAGTGKTTVIADYARKWNKHRGLYLAFNKDIAEHARSRMPPWVRAQTVNSLAYQALGVARQKDRLVGRIRRQTIRQAGIDLGSEYLSPDRMMRCILDGLTNFCNDGGNDLQAKHCGLELLPARVQQVEMPRIAAVIRRFVNYQDSGLPFTHDVYLKYFEMFGTIGQAYDYIALDEAQDSNGVTLSIANKSKLPILLIGDSKQAIYAFRGATNAMTAIEAPRFPLTMSWRFGPRVAAMANAVLSHSDEPPPFKVRGRPDRDSVIERYAGKAPARSFLLSRTNGRLLEGLVSIPPQATFYVAGGFDVLANQILSALALSRNEQHKVTDPYVRSFLHWQDMLEEAEYDDPDARKLVKIIADYGDGLPELLERLRTQHRPHHLDAQIMLSTAHKAKGLEADTVVVLDDFQTPREMRARLLSDKMSQEAFEQEINLLYVACTRAKYRLILSPNMHEDFIHVINGDK